MLQEALQSDFIKLNNKDSESMLHGKFECTTPTKIASFPIEQGETVAGYLYRLPLMREPDFGKLMRQSGTERTGRPLSHLYPSGLASIGNRFGWPLSDVDAVLNRNTLLPFFRATLPTSIFHSMETHMKNNHVRGISAKAGMLGGKGRALAGLAACMSCVRNDIKTFGHAIYRRQWAISTVAVCAKHGEPLLWACESCRNVPKYVRDLLAETGVCRCSVPLRPRIEIDGDKEFQFEWEVAKAVDSLTSIGVSNKALSGSDIHRALETRAADLGLTGGRKNIINIRAGYFSSKMSASSMERHHCGIDNDSYLTRFLRKPQENRLYPMSIVAVGIAIYGDAESFLSEIVERDGPTVHASEHGALISNNAGKRLGKGDFSPARNEENILRYVAQISDFIERNAGITRSEVMWKFAYQTRYMKLYAAEILESILPEKVNPMIGLQERLRVARQTEHDVVLAQHIRQRRADHDANPRNYRVSVIYLMAGYWRGSRAMSYFENLPLSRQAIEECSESRRDFLIRMCQTDPTNTYYSRELRSLESGSKEEDDLGYL